MLLYDDIFKWEGWGGVFRLASGSCHLRLYDMKREKNLFHLKPVIAIVQDLPGEDEKAMRSVSVRSCAGHIATQIVVFFNIDHSRMLYVECYPESWYGGDNRRCIESRFDRVNFEWTDNKALKPSWEPLTGAFLEMVKNLIA